MPEREARFFRTPAEWRAWLEANAATATELWVGFFKRGAGESGVTWREAVDEALCFGWIDGVRQGIDGGRYRIRFTPRKATSIWSTVNIARVGQLSAEGRMRPAGCEAFGRRRASHSGIYSHEQAGEPELDDEQRAAFERRPGSWEFLQSQAPSYRKAVLWWIATPSAPRHGRPGSRSSSTTAPRAGRSGTSVGAVLKPDARFSARCGFSLRR